MRKTVLAFFIAATVAIFSAAPAVSAADIIIKEPPASMDKLYPPVSTKKLFLEQMHQVSLNFAGAKMSLGADDLDSASKFAESFLAAYVKAAKMVPEWKDAFDTKTAEEFAGAAKAKNKDLAGQKIKSLGKVCHDCHVKTRVAVWLKYYWPSIDSVKMEEPISGKQVSYEDYKTAMMGNFMGLMLNLSGNKFEQAAKNAAAFEKQYNGMKSSCKTCHTDENVKLFFVGEKQSQALAGLVKELQSPQPDAGKAWGMFEVVEEGGCVECHVTHRMAYMLKEGWEEGHKH